MSNLPKGWNVLALNQICDLQNGYAFKSNDYDNISNTLNCMMSNIRPALGTQFNSPAAYYNDLIGKTISINLKHQNNLRERTTYFGVGDIWLTPKNYWATIPADMKSSDYKVIRNALNKGIVVLGKKYIPPIEKNKETVQDYVKLLSSSRIANNAVGVEIADKFKDLLKKKVVDGWTVSEIVSHCIAKERAGRSRDFVLRFLNEVNDMYDGPVKLYEDPDEAEGKKVTIVFGSDAPEEKEKGPAKYVEPKRPSNIPGGNIPTDKALNNLLS
jgi:hypothetical protein